MFFRSYSVDPFIDTVDSTVDPRAKFQFDPRKFFSDGQKIQFK